MRGPTGWSWISSTRKGFHVEELLSSCTAKTPGEPLFRVSRVANIAVLPIRRAG